MRDKDQQFIYTKDELALIQRTFAENDALLYTIRKVFLQFPLTDAEKNLIRISVTEPVITILRKRMLPDISEFAPLGQLSDIRTTLTADLKVKDIEGMAPLFAAKQLEIDYLTRRFAELGDIEAIQPHDESELSALGRITGDAKADYINQTAYLFILGYIDPCLQMIKTIAGTKEETMDEKVERMSRNSTK